MTLLWRLAVEVFAGVMLLVVVAGHVTVTHVQPNTELPPIDEAPGRVAACCRGPPPEHSRSPVRYDRACAGNPSDPPTATAAA